jgi:hypothetical protein
MRRLRFGPALAAFTTPAPIPVDPHPDQKGDVTIEIRQIKADTHPAIVTLGQTPHDPATSIPLQKVHLVIIPVGHGQPDSPEAALASSYPKFEVDVSSVTDTSDVQVALEGLPEGDQLGLTILEDEVPDGFA